MYYYKNYSISDMSKQEKNRDFDPSKPSTSGYRKPKTSSPYSRPEVSKKIIELLFKQFCLTDLKIEFTYIYFFSA